MQAFKNDQKPGQEHGGVGGFDGEIFSEKTKTYKKQYHIYNERKGTCRQWGDFREDDSCTGDTTKTEIIWKLKEVYADCHNKGAQRNNKKTFYLLHDTLPLA